MKVLVNGREIGMAVEQALQAGCPLGLVRALAGELGYTVEIDESNHLIQLNMAGSPSSGASELDNLAKTIVAAIEAESESVYGVGKFIWDNPERQNKEYKAAKILSDTLEQHGFTVTRGLNGIKNPGSRPVFLDTAFKAVFKGSSEGPTIAFMLEYDALPAGHACGHNLIATSGLAAAIGLSKVMPDLPGTLVVVGTPAEEGGPYGKVELLAAGNFAGVDVAMITHPMDRWGTHTQLLSVISSEIHFKGVPSHAAAAPEKGISALDAAYLMFNAIDAMREHIRQDSRIHGIFTDGGQAANIVPERAAVRLIVRALDTPYVEVLKKRIENIIQGVCLCTGATAEYEWGLGWYSPVNVKALNTLVLDYAKMAGADYFPYEPEGFGSSDLGNVGYEIPTVNLAFAITPKGIAAHTNPFMEAAGTREAHAKAMIAAKALSLAAYAICTRPQLLTTIREQFAVEKANLVR